MATKFKVGIIGGGVAGVTMALALSRFPNIEIDIYEAAAKFGEIGAGLSIWHRTWSLLVKLGLKDLGKVLSSVPSDEQVRTFDFYKCEEGRVIKFFEMYSRGGLSGVHRAAFHDVLVKYLPKTCRVHLSKRLQSYSQNNALDHCSEHPTAVQMQFEDGTTASCDLLVGADGIKSPVRRCLIKENANTLRSQGKVPEADELLKSIEPIWTGAVNYRMIIPLGRLRAALPSEHPVPRIPSVWCSKESSITMYPLPKADLLNISAVVSEYQTKEWTKYDGPHVEAVPIQTTREIFAHFGTDVKTILNSADSASKWAIHAVKPFQSWYSGNVVLIGDAAHAFAPHQGSGAGQAVEDAYILSTLLGHELTTLTTLSHALEVYQSIRLPFAYDIGARSQQNARWFSLMDLNYDSTRTEQENLRELGQLIESRWKWAWCSDAEDDCVEAVRRLEGSFTETSFA